MILAIIITVIIGIIMLHAAYIMHYTHNSIGGCLVGAIGGCSVAVPVLINLEETGSVLAGAAIAAVVGIILVKIFVLIDIK